MYAVQLHTVQEETKHIFCVFVMLCVIKVGKWDTFSLFLLVSVQKKLPLTTLAQCMVEGAAVLGDESLLG